MKQRSRFSIAVLVGAALLAMLEPVNAGQQPQPKSLRGQPLARSAASAVPATAVIEGQILNIDRTPLAFARVRLRNLDSGTVVEQKATDYLGEFSFSVAHGTYIAEHFDDTNRVLATSDALIVEAGQTVGALILLPTRVPSFAGLFGNSAAAIVSAAAGAGITAVTSTGQPLSPEQ